MNTDTKPIHIADDTTQREVKIEIPECKVHTSSYKNKPKQKRSSSVSLQEAKKEFYKDVAGLDPVLEGQSTKTRKKCSSMFKKEESKEESPFRRRYWVYFIKEMQGNLPPSGGPLQYDPSTRQGFVRFVFMLVFIMLSVTALLVIIVWNVDFLYDIFSDRSYFWVLMIPAIIVLYAMGYVFGLSECSRRVPCNYICLVIVVLAYSVLVAVVTCRYQVRQIAIAVVVTALVAGFCLALACTSFDFTRFYLYFVVIAFGVSVLGMGIFISMKVFGWRMKWLVVLILFVYVIISSISIIMELQMILGGRTIEIGEEDYALAAYMLYSSIIELFRQLVSIIGILDQ